MDYIKLVGGLILLVFSGDYLVKGAVSIASKLKISPLVIGMTIVAFGTSAPELLVSLQSAITGNPEIAIGNVVGSNIANIALILGITAIVYPVSVIKNSIRFDWPVMMIATLLFTWASSDGRITFIEGLIGFSLLVIYTGWQIWYSRKNHLPVDDTEEESYSVFISILMILASAVGLAFGAKFLIEGASNIALSWGVSERIIGITIVAFGTSLPELAASVSAAMKKESDIAIGNIIGSNLFNILCVVGLTSMVKPITVDWSNFSFDYWIMIAFSVLLIILILPIRRIFHKDPQEKVTSIGIFFSKGKIGRIGGIVLTLLYIGYIFLILEK